MQPNFSMPQSVAAMGVPRAEGATIWPPQGPSGVPADVACLPRYYSAGLDSSESDYSVGTAATRIVRFDLPSVLYTLTAGVNKVDGSALPVGWNPLDTFSILLSTANGERITVESRLAGSVCGTAERPGFLLGKGWQIGAGSSLVLQLTPRLAGCRIDVTLGVLEYRTGSSYTAGR